jgi:hypothetical protein
MFRCLSLLILLCYTFSSAEVRYVSKTGSSTPPYTSWETASDSIQKCINYSNDGDTIIVANGVYKEYLSINTAVTLLGTSMDSTVIDARGLIVPGDDSLNTISLHKDLVMKNFHIYGHWWVIISTDWTSRINISHCFFESSYYGIVFQSSGNIIENCIIRVNKTGIHCAAPNGAPQIIKDNLLILMGKLGVAIDEPLGYSSKIITGNIMLHINKYVSTGIWIEYPGRTEIRNNLIAGFLYPAYEEMLKQDSIIIENNIFGYAVSNSTNYGLVMIGNGDKYIFRNNILIGSAIGISTSNLKPDYNLYWDIVQKYNGQIIPGEHEIEADPMFVKANVPGPEFNFDFHLQAHSPAIDAGDPSVLDVDGTRSDIGMYGGPFGQKSDYPDLAPKMPKGLSASVDSAYVYLKWKKNTEADLNDYRIYSDTVSGFTPGESTMIAEIKDTFFIHTIKGNPSHIYYRIAAVDSQLNLSPFTEEIGVVISSVEGEDPMIIQEYMLYQNYPNPFNPSTRIPFRLKESGSVRITVYDITGQRVAEVLNEYRTAGYHEVEFRQDNHNSSPFKEKIDQLVSGIYFFRIEVIGSEGKPVFTDMKKMMLLK